MENTDTPTQSAAPQKGNVIKIIVGIAIILLLGIGAWYAFMGKKPVSNQTSTTATTSVTAQPTQATVFSSIQDALSKSLSLQCDYTDETGKKIVSYMKAGAIRTDIQAADPKQSGSMIIKDKKMYFWNGKTGTMIAFDISEMTKNITPPAKKSTTSAAPAQNPSDVIGSLEKFKQYCKAAVVADSLFVTPTDVKFTDLSQVMKAIPTGGAMTQEQLKELQKQYEQ